MVSNSTHIPKSIVDNFNCIEVLSTIGGMGLIFKCTSKDNRVTAVKCVKEDHNDPDFIARFKREIRILRTLDHPNVIKILKVNDSTPPYWYEMEYAHHGDLKRNIPLIQKNIDLIKNIFVQICEGLKYLHEHERIIIHRDLKPQNILFFNNNLVKISDVGLARFVNRDTISITYTGSSAGTQFYISPEQINDFKHVDIRTDIYALGVILFEMFTDSPNMAGYDLDSDIPRPFNSLIRKMVMYNKENRYQTVEELLLDYKSRIKIYEEVSPYEHPEKGFEKIINKAKNKGSLVTEDFNTLDKILRDNLDRPDFLAEHIQQIPDFLLDQIEARDLNFLKQIIRYFVDAIDEIMKNPFPFWMMNPWTDFLIKIFKLTQNPAIKLMCLKKIVFMACSMNQFYSMEKLCSLLSDIHSDQEIELVFECLRNENDRSYVYSSARDCNLHPRLRSFLILKNDKKIE